MKAVIIANSESPEVEVVAEHLRDIGFVSRVLRREESNYGSTLVGPDLVLSLGSDWSVFWPEVRRFVDAESHHLLRFMKKGVPIFGICFGAQILSYAFGGQVSRAKVPEFGWHDVESVDAFPVFDGTWFQWHKDVFSVPQNGRSLAKNPIGTQAFQLQRCLGTQFHPEITEAILRHWVMAGGHSELEAFGHDPVRLLLESEGHYESSSHRFQTLFQWFLESVAYIDLPPVVGTSAQT